MLMVLISWIVDVDSVDSLKSKHRWQFKPILSPMYRYLGRYINTSGLNNQHFPIALIIDGVDTSYTAIVSMSMLQPITSMALSPNDADTIDDASMADPLPYGRRSGGTSG
jgi:hypothetical protein